MIYVSMQIGETRMTLRPVGCLTSIWQAGLRAFSMLIIIIIAGAPATLHADDKVLLPAPERQVEGNRIVSEANPAMTVVVPQEAKYLGARRILINAAFDAEIHVYAEVDPYDLIERFYWIQFESYLPDTPGRYDYAESNPDIVIIDGIEMHVRPGGDNTVEGTIRPGSDYAAFRE
ncbi:hypothetical protein AAD018_017795 [Aestuariibius insulae]|uniref:hypothetical protein n=1 Tax=Aestuariibius insulae TaxID=2058287 RepID=UPI00345E6487